MGTAAGTARASQEAGRTESLSAGSVVMFVLILALLLGSLGYGISHKSLIGVGFGVGLWSLIWIAVLVAGLVCSFRLGVLHGILALFFPVYMYFVIFFRQSNGVLKAAAAAGLLVVPAGLLAVGVWTSAATMGFSPVLPLSAPERTKALDQNTFATPAKAERVIAGKDQAGRESSPQRAGQVKKASKPKSASQPRVPTKRPAKPKKEPQKQTQQP